MSETGIGIIGCGVRLREVVRGMLAKNEGLRVTALCDPSSQSIEEARQRIAPEAKLYQDYRDLVNDPKVTWVMVGSWNCFHRQHAIAALEAGKHVFCEKPLATTLEDALAIRDAHQRSSRQFVIGFTLRYTSHYRRIHTLLQEGAIGRIISFEFNETLGFNHGGFINQDWRRLTKNAGSYLLEKCCHDIDAANWCTGSLASRVASFGGNDFFTPDNAHHASRIGPNLAGQMAYQGWPGAQNNPFLADKDILDNQVAIIEYANGVRATFHTNCNAAILERRNYIVGSEGTIRADLIRGRIELQRLGWDEPRTIYPSVAGGHGGGDEIMTRELGDVMLRGTAPATTIADGLKAAVTCFALDQAQVTGDVIDVRPLWAKANIGGSTCSDG